MADTLARDFIMDRMRDIGAVISRTRFDLSDEKATQAQIANVLDAAGIAFVREERLSISDRPDFMLLGIAMEVKLRASKMEIWRQLCRYARHDRVTGVMLVSNTAMPLPPAIEGKPAAVINLGKAWL